MKSGKFVKLITVSIFFASTLFARDYQSSDSAKAVLEKFCTTEFDGSASDYRPALVKFSSERQRKEEQNDEAGQGWIIWWDSDEFMIVTSYRVAKVEVKGKKGRGIVVYRRLARSEGRGKLVLDFRESDTSVVSLLYSNNRWWVYDPPLPRTSVQALLGYYNNAIKTFGERGDTVGNKEIYDQLKSNADFLKNLLSDETGK